MRENVVLPFTKVKQSLDPSFHYCCQICWIFTKFTSFVSFLFICFYLPSFGENHMVCHIPKPVNNCNINFGASLGVSSNLFCVSFIIIIITMIFIIIMIFTILIVFLSFNIVINLTRTLEPRCAPPSTSSVSPLTAS